MPTSVKCIEARDHNTPGQASDSPLLKMGIAWSHSEIRTEMEVEHVKTRPRPPVIISMVLLENHALVNALTTPGYVYQVWMMSPDFIQFLDCRSLGNTYGVIIHEGQSLGNENCM